MTMEQEKQTIQNILNARKYDDSKPPKPQHVAFTIQEKIIGTLGSYVVFTGLAKSGKSTFLSAAIGSAYLPSYQDNFTMKLILPENRKRIGYFDTESAPYDFYKQIEKIKKFAMRENLPEQIDCFNTREDEPKLIKEMILHYLNTTPDCAILIVDGFLDLCFNYNDEVETRLLTNWFKKITKEYNIMLIGVLHVGKGGNNETLGHLGSNTDRWANSTLLIEKNKEHNHFLLKSKFLRSAADFDTICVANYDGVWMRIPYMATDNVQLPKKTKK